MKKTIPFIFLCLPIFIAAQQQSKKSIMDLPGFEYWFMPNITPDYVGFFKDTSGLFSLKIDTVFRTKSKSRFQCKGKNWHKGNITHFTGNFLCDSIKKLSLMDYIVLDGKDSTAMGKTREKFYNELVYGGFRLFKLYGKYEFSEIKTTHPYVGKFVGVFTSYFLIDSSLSSIVPVTSVLQTTEPRQIFSGHYISSFNNGNYETFWGEFLLFRDLEGKWVMPDFRLKNNIITVEDKIIYINPEANLPSNDWFIEKKKPAIIKITK